MILRLLLLLALALSNSSCNSLAKAMKKLVSKKPANSEVSKTPSASYNKSANYGNNNMVRQYRRMNQKTFEAEAKVEPQQGSLWVMEGQGSYLFAQNKRRLVGDIVNVRLEGSPVKQLNQKVKTIESLLNRKSRQARMIAAARKKQVEKAKAAAQAAAQGQNPAAAAQNAGQNQPGQANPGINPQKDDNIKANFDVKIVPARIIERYPDGTYRVKGSRSFMIGQKEFKVLVVGLAKSGDIADDYVNSSALLDSRFDVITSRRR